MVQVIGYKHSDIEFKDGNKVSGWNLFVTEKRDGVNGQSCDRLFLSENKANGYKPSIGDNLQIFWNRYGKIDSVSLIKR